MDFPAGPVLGQIFTSGNVTYVWNGYAWAVDSAGGGGAGFVLKAGDTMTGFLTLSADPVQPLHAATKQYVDATALPLGGVAGQALVKDPVNVPAWGAPISAGNF